jgi:hypothetical protein
MEGTAQELFVMADKGYIYLVSSNPEKYRYDPNQPVQNGSWPYCHVHTIVTCIYKPASLWCRICMAAHLLCQFQRVSAFSISDPIIFVQANEFIRFLTFKGLKLNMSQTELESIYEHDAPTRPV